MRNFSVIFTALMIAIAPIGAMSQSYEQTRNFCRMSQMLIPIFLRGGNISGKSVCEVGGVPSFQCNNLMSLGAGICMAGGVPSFQCNNSMSLGAGICMASGVPSFRCNSSMSYAHGVCMASGVPSFQCNDSMTLGQAVCMAGGVSSSQCLGIGHQDLGIGICMALGGSRSLCANVSVSGAICGFTGNCIGSDAASIANSMVQTCGPGVMRYGIE